VFLSIHLSRPRTPAIAALLPCLLLAACNRSRFPDVPAGYREFAYVSDSGSNTVSVLDLVYLRQDRTLQVGTQPTGVAANPKRNEIYVVNTGSGSLSVIDAVTNQVAATIPLHKQPAGIDVAADGRRAYVVNTGSNNVSVIDLERRREIGIAGTGKGPSVVRIAPDLRTLVVTNRISGSVSIFSATPDATGPAITPELAQSPLPHLRAAFAGCPGASDAVILPDSSKVFVTCSDARRVMAISLAAAPDSWAAKQNQTLLIDHLLALLEVGTDPVQLALKPDGGEIFVSNAGSDSITEISTQTNEVGGSYTIGSHPMWGIVSADNATLWVANSGADSIGLWAIDDGKLLPGVRAGGSPSALAFSADEHLLLATDARSGDVAVIRTAGKTGAALFTILPAGAGPSGIAIKAMQRKPMQRKP
jgi:YVTN family beta-propeller protein